MFIGITIDFFITFLVCLIIYLCTKKHNRPNKKTILKVLGLGVLSIVLALVLGNMFSFFYSFMKTLLNLLVTPTGFISFIDAIINYVLAFVILEELAKYFLFNRLWNNGDLEQKSPLQTALIFIIVGATFSFIEDTMYILKGVDPIVRIITIVSGHLTYALIYSLYFSKEVIRSKCLYKMDEYLETLKRNPKFYNIYHAKEKFLLKGFFISSGFHFLHNILSILGGIGIILLFIEIVALTVFFIVKIVKLAKKDVSYDTLAKYRISCDFPGIEKELVTTMKQNYEKEIENKKSGCI